MIMKCTSVIEGLQLVERSEGHSILKQHQHHFSSFAVTDTVDKLLNISVCYLFVEERQLNLISV